MSENRQEQGKFPYQIVAPSSCARGQAAVPSNVKTLAPEDDGEVGQQIQVARQTVRNTFARLSISEWIDTPTG